MKQKKFFGFSLTLLVTTLLLILSACSSNTPAPTAAPTTAPATTVSATTAPAAANNTTVAALTTGTPTVANRTVTAPAANNTTVVAATTAPAANGSGATMKEAYSVVEPLVKKWQADAIYIAIFNNLDNPIGISPDGRSPEWYFQAVSAKVNKRGTWVVKPDAANKPAASQTGDEDLPADMIKTQTTRSLPAISTMIDSSELMAVARQNGGDKSDRPVGFYLAKPPKEGDPLAFNLVFTQGSKTIPLRIDALTGKVLDIARG